MSKPEIEFKLSWWNIQYSVQPTFHYDETKSHFEAQICYVVKHADDSLKHIDRKYFNTFGEAEKYIEKEVGVIS